jgi:hypothetical protein
VHGAAQLLPVRLRNERFEVAVLKEVIETREARRCSEHEKVDLFISYARTMHSVLAVPKNEPAANNDRVAMASTSATVAWIDSRIPQINSRIPLYAR